MRNFQAGKGLYGFLLAAVLFMFIVSVSEGAVWTTETVDDPSGFSNLSSRTIALDSNGNPHIAYGGEDLYYAYYDGGSWHYETLDSSLVVGWYASIAIDSSDNVHISYFDNANKNLKYTTNATGTWVSQTLDRVGEVGRDTSIAI